MLDREREWLWCVFPWIRDFVSNNPTFAWGTTSADNFRYARPDLQDRFRNRLLHLLDSCIALVGDGVTERLSMAFERLPLALCRLTGEEPKVWSEYVENKEDGTQ